MSTTVQLRLGAATAQLDELHPRILIGRDAQFCGLVADDGSISRRHAEVYLEGGVPFIRDLGSSNGTWVNGQPVQYQPVQLAPGQQIYVGHVPMAAEWQGAIYDALPGMVVGLAVYAVAAYAMLGGIRGGAAQTDHSGSESA